MSLNWKEIDLVLSELDLSGARIEKIVQPSYDAVCLVLYKSGRTVDLLVSVAHGACRLHALSSPPPKPQRPLRFMECLRSRIRGGRVESVRQLGEERIVRFDISAVRADEDGPAKPQAVAGEAPSGLRRYRLYARLWSGAGNLVLVDEEGLVVDALARRPKRGEISGERCAIEIPPPAGTDARQPREFAVRELPGEGSFNRRVEAWYAERGGEISRERLLEAARERHRRKVRVLEARIDGLARRAGEFRDAERMRELGDILMANQGSVPVGNFLICDDFYRGGEIDIPVDPRLGAVENARAYYERHRKAKSGLADVEAELESARASLSALDEELSAVEAQEDPFLMARSLAKGGTVGTREKRSYPGLSLEVAGWTILVGRSAKENDELLRRHVRGSDLWLHARDWAGSYVFIRARPGKTVPLDVLLDAGCLAIYYSKGRANGGGDLYYTHAKYLRRVKNGPKGLVIPTQERNLTVKLEEGRMRELRSLIGDDKD